jgi:hypothetical protein
MRYWSSARLRARLIGRHLSMGRPDGIDVSTCEGSAGRLFPGGTAQNKRLAAISCMALSLATQHRPGQGIGCSLMTFANERPWRLVRRPRVPRPIYFVPNRFLGAQLFLLAGGLASAGLAANGLQWRLEANVPVMCTIIAVEPLIRQPGGFAITTICNAERFQLLLRDGSRPAGLRAAQSSAGPVQVSPGAVTITSKRPGEAVTTVELTAPTGSEALSVMLQPI